MFRCRCDIVFIDRLDRLPDLVVLQRSTKGTKEIGNLVVSHLLHGCEGGYRLRYGLVDNLSFRIS